MKGRVAVLRNYGGEFELREYPVPEVEPGRNLTRFPFPRLISHVYPLERITEGFREADWMQRQGGAAPVSRAAVGMA